MAFNYEFPYTDPNFYNDDWLLARMKELLSKMDDIEAWRLEYAEAYEDYKNMVEAIESGNFPESIQSAFTTWMTQNAVDLVGALITSVFFGLTDTGYFIAYIPESWRDIIFETTGFDVTIADYDYGHLVLSY